MDEVFVVREASVQSLAQRYRLPVDFCQQVNDKYRRYADVLLALYSWTMDISDGHGLTDEEVEISFSSFMRAVGMSVTGLIDRFPAKKKELLALTKTSQHSDVEDRKGEIYSLSQQLRADADAPDISHRAVITMPDGSYWVKLEADECDVEGDRMQHCGKSEGTMYSLRDKAGKPHVTADIVPDGGDISGPVHGGDGPRLVMCRGKQNAAPDRKYWPAVLELLQKVEAGPSEAGSSDGVEDALYDWLEKEMGLPPRGGSDGDYGDDED